MCFYNKAPVEDGTYRLKRLENMNDKKAYPCRRKMDLGSDVREYLKEKIPNGKPLPWCSDCIMRVYGEELLNTSQYKRLLMKRVRDVVFIRSTTDRRQQKEKKNKQNDWVC